MGKLTKFINILILIFIFYSCIPKGYDNVYGVYVPKKEKYKFKNYPFYFPPKLDTTNFYILSKSYYMGKLTHSIDLNLWENYGGYREKNINSLKFFSNGRCLDFNIPTKQGVKDQNLINKFNLIPDKIAKSYYYYDGSKMIIETFVYGEGYGKYIYLNYYLSANGDTLTSINNNSKDIYVIEKTPKEWKRINVNW